MKYLIVVALLLNSCAWAQHHCAYGMGFCDKPTELMTIPADSDGVRLHWDKTKLPIALEYGPLGDKSIAAYTAGAQWINEQAGCQIFAMPVWAEKTRKYTVDLTCYNEMEKPEGQSNSSVEADGTITYSELIIPCATPFDETQILIATHELLHVVGLNHDANIGIIMAPNVISAAMELDEKDLQLLKNGYCGKEDVRNY